MQAERWDDLRRVLAIRLDNVGDMVLMGPALRAMRAGMPDARITLMASPAGSQMAPMLPWADDVMTYSVVWQDASATMAFDPARELDLVADIRRRGFDAAFIFTSFSQSPWPPAYACYMAGVPIRVGQSKEFGGSLLTHAVAPLADDAHQAERNLHLVETVGIPARGRMLELDMAPAARRAADVMLDRHGIGGGDPFIAVSPGASCAARRYDASRFAEVVGMLAREARTNVVLLGSARERELLESIADRSACGAIVLCGETSIPELAAVIERASLLIANDSGPMHIADAVGCPMVILYSGTEYESQWAPRSAPTVLLRRPTPCSPCYAFTCPYEMECLDIPPEEVAEQALVMLQRHARPAKEHVLA